MMMIKMMRALYFCIIMISYLVFFLTYFIILIFSRTTNCKSVKKINPCLFIPNCTRNHVITYTTMLSSAGSDLRDI